MAMILPDDTQPDELGSEAMAVTGGLNQEENAAPFFCKSLTANQTRRIGLLSGKAEFSFSTDFKMTDEELLDA